MGAIKPPWISKEEFYRLPFNFCDRWCQHCQLTSICKVYFEEQKDRKQAIKEGKDPDSIEFAFEVMAKNLKKTFKLIEKSVKQWGIDLKKIEKEAEKEDFTKPPVYEKHPLYKAAAKLSLQIHNLLKKFEVVPIETKIEKIKDDLDVLIFYQNLILAKIARSLSSEEREKNYPEDIKSYDDKTSAFIAYHALDKLSQSLLNLAKEKTLDLTRKKCLTLAKASLDLANILAEEFDFDS